MHCQLVIIIALSHVVYLCSPARPAEPRARAWPPEALQLVSGESSSFRLRPKRQTERSRLQSREGGRTVWTAAKEGDERRGRGRRGIRLGSAAGVSERCSRRTDDVSLSTPQSPPSPQSPHDTRRTRTHRTHCSLASRLSPPSHTTLARSLGAHYSLTPLWRDGATLRRVIRIPYLCTYERRAARRGRREREAGGTDDGLDVGSSSGPRPSLRSLAR